MSSSTSFLRLATMMVLLGTSFQACGGLNDAQVTVIPDGRAGDAGAKGSGGNNNVGEGGSANNTAGDGSMTGDAGAPIGGMPPVEGSCTLHEPCVNGTVVGLCVEGECVACTDEADDEACSTVYGEGQLCVDGTCVEGNCRVDEDCPGGTCTDHKCESCTIDTDCLEFPTICNTTTGACVTNASCGAAKNGAACPVNAQDRCCAASNAVCQAVDCCGTEACSTDGQGVNDGACKGGHCVRATCNAPPIGFRFVDFDAPPGGSGSKDCPYKRLGDALADLANAGGNVIVRGETQVTLDNSIALGTGITIFGATADFTQCSKALCPDPTKWPTIVTGNRRAANMVTPGNRTLKFLRFIGVEEGMEEQAEYAGLYVSTATLKIDHVQISGYQFGLYADAVGSIEIGQALSSHHNRVGLYIADGDGAAGGSAAIVVPEAGEVTSFNSNNFGISCHGNGRLTIAAPAAGPDTPALVTLNDNAGSGLFLSSENLANDIVGIEVANNGAGPAALSQRDGATIFAHAAVKIRDSYFHDNAHHGIHIPSNGENTAKGLDNINLGLNAGNGAGGNYIIDNKDTGICVEPGPTVDPPPNSLHIAGNIFRGPGGDCRVDTSTYKRAKTCKGGVDYSGNCAGIANVEACEATPATCQ